jgi:RimJ/RimL family protein N-acetyltransferase
VTGIQTKRLTLVPHTPEDVRAQIERMDPEQRRELSPAWLARVDATTAPDPWLLGFSMVERATSAVIGTCGFKGPPDPEGIVEIAYGVDPAYQGQGYATEAAQALVARAFAADGVRVVRAHTRVGPNASTRVLAKCGFGWHGEVVDPEDGLVWRWETTKGARP